MTNLVELARKWKTDKVDYHSYAAVYEELLSGVNVRKVLEIGIGTPEIMQMTPAQVGYQKGASLRMWSERFPEAYVYGIDVLPEALVNEGRIRSYQCDQGDEEALRRAAGVIGGNLDLVVDDGSHVPVHQALAARVFVPLLSPFGVFVIEDIAESALLLPLLLPFSFEMREMMNVADDRMVIIRA